MSVLVEPESTKRTLLNLTYLDDVVAVNLDQHEVCSGMNLHVTARTFSDGRVRVAGSVSLRYHRQRGSGKVFTFWRRENCRVVARTKRHLVTLQDLPRTGRRSTTHLFTNSENGSWSAIAVLLNSLMRTACDGLGGAAMRYSDVPHQILELVDGVATPVSHQTMVESIQASCHRLAPGIEALIGSLPSDLDRFPLRPMGGGHERLYADQPIHAPALTASGQTYFLDAENYRQVAANAFGVTRVRRPLVREVERLSSRPILLSWFRLFRGLVPIDWIIDAMREVRSNAIIRVRSEDLRVIRNVLRRVPQPILRRILAEPIHGTVHVLTDIARKVGTKDVQTRDLSALPELISARGQKHIRSARDLEGLIRAMPEVTLMRPAIARAARAVNVMLDEHHARRAMEDYNQALERLGDHTGRQTVTWLEWKNPQFQEAAAAFLAERRRELMDARQREAEERAERYRQERLTRETERAAWATKATAELDGVVAGGYRLVVARDANTLNVWGAKLSNCIGSYARDLGLDVFVAAVDHQDVVKLNIQITQESGVVQFLGSNNLDAVVGVGPKDAQLILDSIMSRDVAVRSHALGTAGLRTCMAELVTA